MSSINETLGVMGVKCIFKGLGGGEFVVFIGFFNENINKKSKSRGELGTACPLIDARGYNP